MLQIILRNHNRLSHSQEMDMTESKLAVERDLKLHLRIIEAKGIYNFNFNFKYRFPNRTRIKIIQFPQNF